MSGKVIAGEKFKVVVKFFPGIPDNINELILVECGHFPAVRVKVSGIGIYPGCLLSFPRAVDTDFIDRVEGSKARAEAGEVGYAAPFGGSEAVKLMPALPTKLPDREKALMKESQVPHLEAEADADRELLCEMILAKLE
jgi:hypothetical protein